MKNKKNILIIGLAILLFFVVVLWLRPSLSTAPTAAITPDDINTSTVLNTVSSTAQSSSQSVSAPISTPVTVAPKPQTIDIGHAVGIASGGGLSKINVADMNQELDQMVTLGVTWVRFDIEWGDVQYSSPSSSNWTNYDTLVSAIAAHHLKGLAILLFTPQWARDPSCSGGAKCPPANPAQFATFASEVAARYDGKGIDAYEIWNEENDYDFWATKTDCNAYAALLKATYPAIKAADPNAIVVSGGLAPAATDNHNISQMDFLSCIYKDGGKNYFDAMGDHAYTFPALPSSNNTNIWAQMSETTPSLRSIMIANGDANKKIWITEFGAPTNGPSPQWEVTEAGQAAMVTDAMKLYETYSWAGPIFWYTIKDGGTDTSTQENFFGLIRADNSLKPAYTTLQNIISAGL